MIRSFQFKLLSQRLSFVAPVVPVDQWSAVALAGGKKKKVVSSVDFTALIFYYHNTHIYIYIYIKTLTDFNSDKSTKLFRNISKITQNNQRR